MSDAHRARSGNTVIIRDDIGKAKASIYSLPNGSHAYGRAEPPDVEGAREVTMHWASHVPRPKPTAGIQDFAKINKLAAQSQCKNAQQFAEFRTINKCEVKAVASQQLQPKVIPSDVIPSFAYGRKSRPSTPISNVVGYQYAQEAEEALGVNYNRYSSIAPAGKMKVRTTRATEQIIANARLARSFPNTEPKELFKMKKFAKTGSRLNLAPINRAVSMPTLPPALAGGLATGLASTAPTAAPDYMLM